MGDVFISYSRMDSEFGRQLHAALVARRRKVFMDWSDIPRTAEWWQKITEGIELSDNFVFLISEDSVSSPLCNLEIEYARSLNKRVVPVLVRKTDEKKAHVELVHRELSNFQQALLRDGDLLTIARDNWKKLAGINWIDFTLRSDFDVQVNELCAVLDMDLSYVQEHTRLLTRAQDWMRHKKLPSLLLRADDLLNAEEWLKSNKNRVSEPPTSIHCEYIAESRRVEDEEQYHDALRERRIRQFRLAAASFGVLVVLAAMGGAFFASQASSARYDVATAVAQAHEANTQVATAQTQIAQAVMTLTPLSSTLAAASQDGQLQHDYAESLRLAGIANNVYLENGNSETVALLAMYALDSSYSEQADALLAKALDRLHTEQILPSGSVLSVAWSPDGQYILTGEQLWNADTGEAIRTFRSDSDTYSVSSVAFSPDGEYILTGSATWATPTVSPDGVVDDLPDTTVKLWDVETGEEVQVFADYSSNVTSVAFSPDGNWALTGSEDRTARLWNIETAEEVQSFEHEGSVEDVAFSPDGNLVLTADSGNNTAQVWDVETGEKVQVYAGHTESISSVDFSPDGRYVLTGSYDNTARIWNARSGKQVQILEGHRNGVTSAVFSPNGLYVLTGSLDETARLWDATTGETIAIFEGHTDGVSSVAFSPDGRYAITGSGFLLAIGTPDIYARIWSTAPDYRSAFVFSQYSQSVTSAEFSHDGKYIFVGLDDNTARVLDISTGEEIYVWDHSAPVSDIDSSSDSRYLSTISDDFVVRLWDISTGQITQTILPESTNSISLMPTVEPNIALSPDGQFVASNYGGSVVKLFDVSEDTLLHTFQGHTDIINDIAFSPDGDYILTASSDQTARLWNVTTGEEVQVLEGHSGDVIDVAFSPNGKQIITGSADRTARIWDIATGDVLLVLDGYLYPITSVAFSPDGQYVLTGEGNSYGGMILMFTDTKAEYRAWIRNAATGQTVRVFGGYIDGINSVDFSPDSKNVLVANTDGTVQFWSMNYHEFLSYACTRVYRELTDAERIEYGIMTSWTVCPQFGVNREHVLERLQSLAERGVIDEHQGDIGDQQQQVIVDLTGEDNISKWILLNGPYSNFIIEATIQWGKGASEDACGFVFREEDNDNFYFVVVNREKQLWFNRRVRGEWLVPDNSVNYVAAIQTEQTQENLISLIGLGNRFSVFINNEYVGEFVDDLLVSGNVGVIGYTGEESDTSNCIFNNVWVLDLVDQ